jgi:hypothetical protein
MTNTYRILHIPSNLYFKRAGVEKNNLDKVGQIYTRKPSLSYLGEYYYNDDNRDEKGKKLAYWQRTITRKIEINDWLIEEYKLPKEQVEEIVADIRNKLGPIISYFKIKKNNNNLQKFLDECEVQSNIVLPKIIKQLKNLNKI